MKATFWYTISSFLMRGIGFITTPIFARLLTKAEFGEYSNIITWYGIIAIVATLSLNASLTRARFDFEGDLERYVASNLLQGSIATVIVFLIVIINKDFFCGLFVIEEKYLYIMFAAIIVSPAYDMFLSVQRFRYKYRLVVLVTVVITLSSAALSVILVNIMPDRLMGRVLGTYIPPFAGGVIIYIYYLVKGSGLRLQYCKYALLISAPYVIHLLSGTVLNSSDKAMITGILGPEANALYSMSATVSAIVNIMWYAIDRAFTPWLGEKLHEKDYVSIRKYTNIYIGIFSCIVVGLMIFAPEILYILGGESYSEAKYAIPPIMVGYLFIMIYSLYANIEQYEKKTAGMAAATGSAALINIVTNAVFIPMFGYLAASYTTLLCDLLMVVFHYLLVRRLGMQDIFNKKINMLVILSSLVFLPLCLIMYDIIMMRAAFMIACVVTGTIIFIKNRDGIMSFIRNK